MLNKKHIIFYFIAIIFIGLIFYPSCKKDKDEAIPYVYVNFTLQPNGIDFIETGGWTYITGYGNRGIIIYRPLQDEFLAYERTCPYDPEKSCAIVEVESSGITAIDSCCFSKFLLTDGSPYEGPATLPLKQYRTKYDGNTLHVFN